MAEEARTLIPSKLRVVVGIVDGPLKKHRDGWVGATPRDVELAVRAVEEQPFGVVDVSDSCAVLKGEGPGGIGHANALSVVTAVCI